MRTHDLATQLELYVKLLRSMPDCEINQALTTLLDLASTSQVELPQTTSRVTQPLPPGIEERLKEMTPTQIEMFLGSDETALSSARLFELAKRLGIASSKRQSRSALINMITRHFEGAQMDSMIRATRKDDSHT